MKKQRDRDSGIVTAVRDKHMDRIRAEQGYPDKLLSVGAEGTAKEQMEMLRAEIKKVWEDIK